MERVPPADLNSGLRAVSVCWVPTGQQWQDEVLNEPCWLDGVSSSSQHLKLTHFQSDVYIAIANRFLA